MFILLLKKRNVSWICRNNEEDNGEAQGDEIRSLGHELEEKEKKLLLILLLLHQLLLLLLLLLLKLG